MFKVNYKLLPCPIKLVISLDLKTDNVGPIIIEHYESREAFFTAFECLMSKRSAVRDIFFQKVVDADTGEYFISTLYVTVVKSFDPIKFTEKRYKNKLLQPHDVTSIPRRLIQGISYEEFVNWVYSLKPAILPDNKLAAKASRFLKR